MAEQEYCYFVSYAHPKGFGSLLIRSGIPADRFEVVDEFRHTIQRTARPRPDWVVVLWWQRLRGDEPVTTGSEDERG